MKDRRIKLCAIVITLMMLISSFAVVTYAAPSSYSASSNSGTRDEVCISLDGTGASSYYTGDYTFENLMYLSSSELKSSLHDLMTDTHQKITTYNDCRDLVWRVDCEKNDTTHATTLYTSKSMSTSDWTPTWSCNREHVWPQSLGGGNTSGGGADLHHIRPAEAGVNSSRGNKAYGEAGGYYEPKDNVKGDVARIILYVHVRWGAAWGATNVTSVFQSVDLLLEWCELDPVDTWEMGRNEVVEDIQGNRNVFIDYPELAWLMYGKAVPEQMITPSGSAYDGEMPVPPPPTEEETTTPEAPAEIPEYFVLKNEDNYVTDKSHTYTSSSSGKTKLELELTSNKSDAAVMQKIENSDNTLSFKANGKYLYADGTDVKFVDAIGSNTKFVLEQNGSGYFVKCANATYSGKPQYLEIYSGYLTCYGMGSNPNIYTFTFEDVNDVPTPPNPDDNEQPDNPDTPSGDGSKLAVFDFGANGNASHNDGAEAKGSVSYKNNGYTITLENLSKIYSDARDATGNSCLKVGTSSTVGSFSFTVPDDVDSVVLHIAQYKVKSTTVKINGTSYSIYTSSNDGQYTPVVIDTSSVKTIELTTVSGATRCLIDTIEFMAAESEPDIENPEDSTEEPTEQPTEESTEEITEEPTEETTEEPTEETTEDSTEETTEHNTEKTTEKVTEKPTEETTEQFTEESTEQNTEVPTEESTENGTEVITEENTQNNSNGEENTTTENKNGGCKSSVASAGVIITAICVGFVATKKKKDD